MEGRNGQILTGGELAMIACVDVDYRESEALAACVLFGDWRDAHSAA